MSRFCRFSFCFGLLLSASVDSIIAAQTSDNMHIRRNIAYSEPSDSKKQLTSLDAYAPAQGTGHPIVVWIHGGGWQIGDKANVRSKPHAFTDKGFVFVSLNYRLVPSVSYKEQAGDVAKAISWVYSNAKSFGGNRERIYVMGHSSGAHIAALISTDDRYLKAEKRPLTTIKGVVLLDGAGYDVSRQMTELAGPRNRQLYETVFGTSVEGWREASPISHVDKDKHIPPFLILYVANRRASKVQSEGLAEVLREAGISAAAIPAKNKTHATINRELGQSEDDPTRVVFGFLKQLEKKANRLD